MRTLDDLERQEWERLEAAADGAEQAFRDHQLTSARAGYRGGGSPGTASVPATGDRDWWARHDELQRAAERARDAADLYWEHHRPR